MSAPTLGIGIREFARRDGCDEKLVRRAIKRGNLSAFPDKSIDPKLVGTEWRQRDSAADTQKEAAHGLGEQLRQRELALARLRTNQLRRRSDEWISPGDARSTWRAVAGRIHQVILSFVPVIAANAAACLVIDQMPAAIRIAVHDALNAVADTPVVVAGPPSPEPEINDAMSKTEAETIKVWALAGLRRLDLAIENGAVISLTLWGRALSNAVMLMRQRLLALEAILPPQLWRSDKPDFEPIIRFAIGEALAELPMDPPPLGSPQSRGAASP